MTKFDKAIKNSFFDKLSSNEQQFIRQKSNELRFSHQEIIQIINIARDLKLWDEGSIIDIMPSHSQKKVVFSKLVKHYEELKNKPNSYKNFTPYKNPKEQKFSFKTQKKDGFGLGLCPVASEKTRCCNLLTLDAVESCGFDCSYCSIQSFYTQGAITFDVGFKEKLLNLKLDKDKLYHIGTGQSSDSLLFGNREGVLDALFDFARKNPNVILEFKTKSDNISYLLDNEVPNNIVTTWSLNTPTIIENEEHLTASLSKRLKSARALADKGVKVGFHFHPIVEYEGYLDEYKKIYDTLQDMFDKSEVVMVSLGTLTFIKPVIKQLRKRDFKTKITQIPHSNASGKTSYPIKTKLQMLRHAYDSFKSWHKDVFFYLCMEEQSLWKDVFGYEYPTNNDFEKAMLNFYAKKMGIDMIMY